MSIWIVEWTKTKEIYKFSRWPHLMEVYKLHHVAPPANRKHGIDYHRKSKLAGYWLIGTVDLITYLATDTILVKCTLGHSWKYINHWIHSVFLIGFHVANYIQTKCHEFAVEKSIHEKHLSCDKRKKNSICSQMCWLIDIRRTLRRRVVLVPTMRNFNSRSVSSSSHYYYWSALSPYKLVSNINK